jgi:hypothetical protein
MKKFGYPALALAVVCAIAIGLRSATRYSTFSFGDVTLTGTQAGHFPQVWDLTGCDLIIRATVDLNGMIDEFGGSAHAWAQLGARTVGFGDFNPTLDVEGAGVWLATDYDWAAHTFGPDPEGAPALDLDDKLMLQKAGGHGDADYDLPATPPFPGNNHRFWFDRDGVDPWQAAAPLAVDGGTYNTAGRYEVEIKLHAIDGVTGTAYLRINSLDQGFETDGDWNTMELTPAGMTFTGDMTRMQVFYGINGFGAPHSVRFEDVSVSGCFVLEEGMATGGGWFIPDTFSGFSPGARATFGFTARQKDEVSAGELEFHAHDAAGIDFKSTSFAWANISATLATFEGTGKLNGEDGYRFRVDAVDGEKLGIGQLDRFEIRIWTGTDTVDSPTYWAEGNLLGGQIVLHKR